MLAQANMHILKYSVPWVGKTVGTVIGVAAAHHCSPAAQSLTPRPHAVLYMMLYLAYHYNNTHYYRLFEALQYNSQFSPFFDATFSFPEKEIEREFQNCYEMMQLALQSVMV